MTTKRPRRRSKLLKLRYFLAALTVGIILAAVTSGGGGKKATGPLSAFVSCINGHPLLATDGNAAQSGGLSILNNALGSGGGIAGNIWQEGHAQAVADGTVMTAFPFRFVAGPYLGQVNAAESTDVRLAIATCAQKIPGQWQSWGTP